MTPEDDLGLVDDEPVVLRWLQARCGAHGAVDIHGLPATSADQVMVVVAHPRLVPSR